MYLLYLPSYTYKDSPFHDSCRLTLRVSIAQILALADTAHPTQNVSTRSLGPATSLPRVPVTASWQRSGSKRPTRGSSKLNYTRGYFRKFLAPGHAQNDCARTRERVNVRWLRPYNRTNPAHVHHHTRGPGGEQ